MTSPNMTDGAKVTLPMCPGMHCRGEKPGREPHGCPYAEEIGGNSDEEYCTCCAACERECADDI